jgi:glycosyltransferase involved in cell wall biosynthesis
MPSITALLHTKNDAIRLGRCLETLYACDQILIVDHGSGDDTLRIARGYGARIIEAQPGIPLEQDRRLNPSEWILTLDPRESLSESLASSLFAWKYEWGADGEKDSSAKGMLDRSGVPTVPAFSVFLREEGVNGWVDHPTAQTRLVPATWKHWNGNIPLHQASAIALHGQLLRFAFP